jgi:hypothetical protein
LHTTLLTADDVVVDATASIGSGSAVRAPQVSLVSVTAVAVPNGENDCELMRKPGPTAVHDRGAGQETEA